ncbi:MAG: ATP-binding cassette domain-containing protein [Planctomycetes bacterium]|nr:ATP-binding cassette domain-containing protein [Planctomycetota bacterium]
MLELREVHKTFYVGTPNEVRSLRGVCLSMQQGSFVNVIGTNGSGKSTLLNAVAGTFLVDSGQIVLGSEEITRQSEHRRARRIGRVFQNPFSGSAPSMTIAENLALASRRGLSRGLGWSLTRSLRDEIADRIRTLKMGLENRLDNPIGSLSGGQRQAITLLMATWVTPDLLLLDEHTAALDPRSADQVIRLTHEIVTRDRLTTLMVTHSMQQAVHLGDRILMMHQGQIVADLSGSEKARTRAEDLLSRFDALRQRDQLTPAVRDLLEHSYV